MPFAALFAMPFAALVAALSAAPACAAGEAATRFQQECAACHGAQALGEVAGGGPALAGLDAAYLARQLRNFARGLRGSDPRDEPGGRMRAAVQARYGDTAGDAAAEALAAYLAALPAGHGQARPAATKGDAAKGRNYFNAICSACHNSNGLGTPALSAPRLAGGDPAYLLRQLAAFRAGTRGADVRDQFGAQMRKMVLTLPGPATDADVVAYIATLAPPAPAARAAR